ncbi:hypothetical protein Gotur_006135 [Gossypium turneri]
MLENGSKKLVLREVFTSVQDSGLLSGYIRTYVFVRFLSPCSHREMYTPELNLVYALVHIRLLDRELIIENGFLDKVEDNAAVQTWSKAIQQKKGDSLAEGYVSELWDFTHLPYLLDIKVHKHLFRALVQF